MSMELWKHARGVSMVKVHSQDEEGIRVSTVHWRAGGVCSVPHFCCWWSWEGCIELLAKLQEIPLVGRMAPGITDLTRVLRCESSPPLRALCLLRSMLAGLVEWHRPKRYHWAIFPQKQKRIFTVSEDVRSKWIQSGLLSSERTLTRVMVGVASWWGLATTAVWPGSCRAYSSSASSCSAHGTSPAGRSEGPGLSRPPEQTGTQWLDVPPTIYASVLQLCYADENAPHQKHVLAHYTHHKHAHMHAHTHASLEEISLIFSLTAVSPHVIFFLLLFLHLSLLPEHRQQL